MMRREMHQVTVVSQHGSVQSRAELSCAPDNDVEHWLNIGGRGRNDSQNLTRGRLALQCFLRLVEQPHILDGDDRLVSEGLEERDFGVRKESRLRPSHSDG